MTKKEKNKVIAKRDEEWIKILRDMGLNTVCRAILNEMKGRHYEGRDTDSDWKMGKAWRKDIDE